MKSIQRAFVPGSKWVYFKLYTGTKTADKIIAQDISVVIRNLEKSQLIEKWFFIRYSDPDFHLRIRVLVKDESFIGDIILLFHKRLMRWIKTGQIWKIQLDTYNRELERYGGNLIEEAESIFHINSDCTLSILKKLIEKDEHYRWMIALKMIDCFLTDFSLDIQSKQLLFSHLHTSFKTEFGFDKYNAKQFNTKFRDHKNIIENVLQGKIIEKDFTSMYTLLDKQSKKLAPLIIQITQKAQRKKIKIEQLLTSYIHMMLNRLFRSKNRIHELVLYDFMYRYYTSELARSKYNKQPSKI